MITVYIEICREGVVKPEYANIADAGMDIRAAEDVTIYPQDTVIVPTGLKMAIPEGYEIQIRPRSGLSLKTPLRLANTPGTIDSGYRDEIGVIITNTSCCLSNMEEFNINHLYEHGNNQGIYHIKKNDRIAQIVLQKVPRIIWAKIDDVSRISGNRHGGYGSTGVM
jgi:dUTP pyrophosphatase